MYTTIYTYIYIYMYTYIHIHTYNNIYIYIYIYVEREREREITILFNSYYLIALRSSASGEECFKTANTAYHPAIHTYTHNYIVYTTNNYVHIYIYIYIYICNNYLSLYIYIYVLLLLLLLLLCSSAISPPAGKPSLPITRPIILQFSILHYIHTIII